MNAVTHNQLVTAWLSVLSRKTFKRKNLELHGARGGSRPVASGDGTVGEIEGHGCKRSVSRVFFSIVN